MKIRYLLQQIFSFYSPFIYFLIFPFSLPFLLLFSSFHNSSLLFISFLNHISSRSPFTFISFILPFIVYCFIFVFVTPSFGPLTPPLRLFSISFLPTFLHSVASFRAFFALFHLRHNEINAMNIQHCSFSIKIN